MVGFGEKLGFGGKSVIWREKGILVGKVVFGGKSSVWRRNWFLDRNMSFLMNTFPKFKIDFPKIVVLMILFKDQS